MIAWNGRGSKDNSSTKLDTLVQSGINRMPARVLLPRRSALLSLISRAVRFSSSSGAISEDSVRVENNGFITELPGVRAKIIDGNALAETVRVQSDVICEELQ